jgi:hypothetical protein
MAHLSLTLGPTQSPHHVHQTTTTFQQNLQSITHSFSAVRYRQYGHMTSSTTLFYFKPSLLHCSTSTTSSSHSLSLKFKFPARPQRPLFPTVQSRSSTPRASSHTGVSAENDSGSGKALHIYIYRFLQKNKKDFF